MTQQTFKLPDLGEGLTESEVLNWKVKVGERVALNQIIAEVETAKAVVELPSPYDGTVQALHASEGEVVQVGADLVTFGDQPVETGGAEPERTPTLVGYGAPAASSKRPARRKRAAAVPELAPEPAPAPVQPERREVARSTPPVRKLARDHGIDIESLQGSGPEGLVLRADVQRAIDQGVQALPAAPAGGLPAHRRVKASAVRRATAKAMTESVAVPQVTEFLTVDVTAALELVDKLRQRREFKDIKLSFSTFASFVTSHLLLRFPALNSAWDAQAQEILEFESVNLGIAVASDRGLMVPVLSEANAKPLPVFAEECSELIAQTRNGNLTPAQLAGGTFSISNVGVFGVDAGTPILPPGQSGIIALGQVKRRPWEYQGELALRNICTLALTFDHRIADGKEGSELLAAIGSVLEDPGMANFFNS